MKKSILDMHVRGDLTFKIKKSQSALMIARSVPIIDRVLMMMMIRWRKGLGRSIDGWIPAEIGQAWGRAHQLCSGSQTRPAGRRERPCLVAGTAAAAELQYSTTAPSFSSPGQAMHPTPLLHLLPRVCLRIHKIILFFSIHSRQVITLIMLHGWLIINIMVLLTSIS